MGRPTTATGRPHCRRLRAACSCGAPDQQQWKNSCHTQCTCPAVGHNVGSVEVVHAAAAAVHAATVARRTARLAALALVVQHCRTRCAAAARWRRDGPRAVLHADALPAAARRHLARRPVGVGGERAGDRCARRHAARRRCRALFGARAHLAHAADGGVPCVGSVSEVRTCTEQCATPATGGVTPCTPVACALTAYTDWSPCQVASRRRRQCVGVQYRSRTISAPPRCGGTACPTVLHDERQCSEACGAPGDGGGMDGGGGGMDNLDGPNIVADGGTRAVTTTAAGGIETTSDDDDAPIALIAGLAGAAALCCLIGAILLLVCFARRSSSPPAQTPMAAAAPSQDNLLVGNPLFTAQEDKSYNPLFYPSGGDNGGAGAGAVGVGAGGGLDGASGGAYPAGATYSTNGYTTSGGYVGGGGGYGGAHACTVCGKSFSIAADLAHHMSKRHAGGGSAAYPSQSSAYPSGM
eukprot:TRINITY_DN5431_c0_g1_i1.p1 TRINITY_DN5431_c0_g1~~TRINITY_DN5431_c0_g1_i1.p1  ORF type:complete len:467 (-),score=192.27 TRINITY_DN5431_c0_g1_i1:23-1423(-)